MIGDRLEVKAFRTHELTTDWTFVGFHYGSRAFEEWREWVEVLAYFNNDWEVFAVRNALWLRRRPGA